ncbi:hypothetical protein BH11PLA2_BH11PLA2_32780 [soil metagenome]
MAATFQSGDSNPVMCPIASATAVTQGSLMSAAATTGIVTPASSFTWDTNLATTRAAFVVLFSGVAGQAKAANADPIGNTGTNAGTIRVDAGGVFRYVSPAAGTYVNGLTLVGPAKAAGNTLTDQTLEVVTTQAQAVGIVVDSQTGTDPTWIDVLILSARVPMARQ